MATKSKIKITATKRYEIKVNVLVELKDLVLSPRHSYQLDGSLIEQINSEDIAKIEEVKDGPQN